LLRSRTQGIYYFRLLGGRRVTTLLLAACGENWAGEAAEQNAVRDAVRLREQLVWLFVLAIPIASIAWTVTREEVLHEWREICQENSKNCRRVFARKFFYVFTCEYCFSHYVTVAFLILTRFKLLATGWLGYVIAGFALVWVANIYMSLFAHIRLEIKRERVEISAEEKSLTKNRAEASEFRKTA
jgi:hypothetical protein